METQDLLDEKLLLILMAGMSPMVAVLFPGKDCTKVIGNVAAYMARYLAKNIVASGKADNCTVQLSYAIGVKEPIICMFMLMV